MKKLALTDFAKYRYPSALELSPDGRYLTFALKDVDREGDGYRWNLGEYRNGLWRRTDGGQCSSDCTEASGKLEQACFSAGMAGTDT